MIDFGVDCSHTSSERDRQDVVRERRVVLAECCLGRAVHDLTSAVVARPMTRTDVGGAVRAVDRAPLVRADRVDRGKRGRACSRDQEHAGDGLDDCGTVHVGQRRSGRRHLHAGVRKLPVQGGQYRCPTAPVAARTGGGSVAAAGGHERRERGAGSDLACACTELASRDKLARL